MPEALTSTTALWLGTALVALSLWIAIELRRAAGRRARRLHYLRLARGGPAEAAQAKGDPPGHMDREQALRIRAAAEQAAREAWKLQREPANPHPRHTAEFVLWAATYHLVLADLSEAARAVPEVGADLR